MKVNEIVSRVLRSPWHELLSGTTMLISMTGRKSGQPVTTPVDYVQDGTTVWVMSLATRHWWRNLRQSAPVQLVLRGQTRQGLGRALVGNLQALQHFLALRPAWAARLHIRRTADGAFDRGDLVRAAAERVLVEIQLTPDGT